jgi:hypothetical protein
LTNANVGTASREPREDVVAELAEAPAPARGGQQRHAGEVGADAEDERLAGDADER